MFKVPEPSPEGWIQFLDYLLDTDTTCSLCSLADFVPQSHKAFLPDKTATRFEPVSQELKALPLLLAIPYMGFVWV